MLKALGTCTRQNYLMQFENERQAERGNRASWRVLARDCRGTNVQQKEKYDTIIALSKFSECSF